MAGLREIEIFSGGGEPLRIRQWGGVASAAEEWGSRLETGWQVFCLNRGGGLLVLGGRSRLHLLPLMSGTFRVAPGFRAMTLAGSEMAFDFVTIEVDPAWIREQFRAGLGSLPRSQASMWEEAGWEVALPAKLMSGVEREILARILSPPVEGVARGFWFRAKILEFLSLQLFREGEPFCSRQKMQVRERVAGALASLQGRLEEPLDLESLAKEAGVSGPTLSRLVSAETGVTLSRHLRAMRVERALELMREEDFNVTEAAMEVGYSSLSHFTKACVVETGRRPSEFLGDPG